jgi:hypothetical protein
MIYREALIIPSTLLKAVIMAMTSFWEIKTKSISQEIKTIEF